MCTAALASKDEVSSSSHRKSVFSVISFVACIGLL